MATRKSTAAEKETFIRAQRNWEPSISEERYVPTLMRYLNHHNRHTNMKLIRVWAQAFVRDQTNARQVAFSKAGDLELRSIGMLHHAVEKGFYVSPTHLQRMANDAQRLIEKYMSVVEKPKEEKVVDVAPKVDKDTIEFSAHKAEVDSAIDEYITSGAPFSMKGYIASNYVSKSVAKRIAESFTPLLAELREAVGGKDDDLNEGYKFLGKIKLKHFFAMVQLIISDCAQAVVAAKAPRKTRIAKVKPASVLVAKLKYLKEFAEMKLTSIPAVNIIGASVVWLFDTAKRKVYVYEAVGGETLSVKGTTLTGWDVTKSSDKIVRKPEEFLSGNMARKVILGTYNALKTKAGAVNGRTNENMIILRAF